MFGNLELLFGKFWQEPNTFHFKTLLLFFNWQTIWLILGVALYYSNLKIFNQRVFQQSLRNYHQFWKSVGILIQKQDLLFSIFIPKSMHFQMLKGKVVQPLQIPILMCLLLRNILFTANLLSGTHLLHNAANGALERKCRNSSKSIRNRYSKNTRRQKRRIILNRGSARSGFQRSLHFCLPKILLKLVFMFIVITSLEWLLILGKSRSYCSVSMNHTFFLHFFQV
jgi:hypothetical protein